MQKYVYLLHFHEPMHHAKHYVGITSEIVRRMKEHSSGQGSAITKAFAEKGIGFDLICVWEVENSQAERAVKRVKNARAMCPKCTNEKPRNPLPKNRRIWFEVLEASGIQITWNQTKGNPE